MRSRWLAELGRSSLGLLPPTATVIAEGFWIAIVYAAVQVGLAGRSEAIDVWAFVVVAAAGMLLARRLRGRQRTVATLLLVVVASLVGWVMDPSVREGVTSGQYDEAIAGGFGWILGLAAWRGGRHGDPDSDDLVVGSLLTWVVPGLAIPWLIGTAVPNRQAFIDVALPATLLFVAAGLVAVGVTRLDALGRAVGVDWRRNRAWLVLLVGVVGLVALIGTPIALLLGASADGLSRMLLGPPAMIGNAIGAIASPIGEGIGQLVSRGAPTPETFAPGPAPGSGLADWIDRVVAVGPVAVLIVIAYVLRRAVASDAPVEVAPSEPEERHIAVPKIVVRRPRFRLPASDRRTEPRTASEAYFAVLRRLAADEVRGRAPAESPAAHARRLRALGAGSLSLDLLAADFELERYRGAALTRSETARAIRRSRGGLRSWRRTRLGS